MTAQMARSMASALIKGLEKPFDEDLTQLSEARVRELIGFLGHGHFIIH